VRKGELLNQPLTNVIAGLGHLDELVIADAGLPVPSQTERVDLALTAGIPGFLDSLQVVMSELEVESAVIAKEMLEKSPQMYHDLLAILADLPVEYVSHENFKEMTALARAVVRTGEFTPYANIILRAGVRF
jgi:D-ribose pyranase